MSIKSEYKARRKAELAAAAEVRAVVNGHDTDTDTDTRMASIMRDIAAAARRSRRRGSTACPARKCYLPMGHDDAVHGLRANHTPVKA